MGLFNGGLRVRPLGISLEALAAIEYSGDVFFVVVLFKLRFIFE